MEDINIGRGYSARFQISHLSASLIIYIISISILGFSFYADYNIVTLQQTEI